MASTFTQSADRQSSNAFERGQVGLNDRPRWDERRRGDGDWHTAAPTVTFARAGAILDKFMLRRSWLEKQRNGSCSPSRSLIAGSTLVEVPLIGLSYPIILSAESE